MAEPRTPQHGKLQFVRQMLHHDPGANERSINQAWRQAGHEGTISRSSVNKVKVQLGLTLPSRGRPKGGPNEVAKAPDSGGFPASPSAEPPADGAAAAATGPAPRTGTSPEGDERGRLIAEVERTFDRALCRAMALGNLPEVEDAIRQARRLFILSTGQVP